MSSGVQEFELRALQVTLLFLQHAIDIDKHNTESVFQDHSIYLFLYLASPQWRVLCFGFRSIGLHFYFKRKKSGSIKTELKQRVKQSKQALRVFEWGEYTRKMKGLVYIRAWVFHWKLINLVIKFYTVRGVIKVALHNIFSFRSLKFKSLQLTPKVISSQSSHLSNITFNSVNVQNQHSLSWEQCCKMHNV